MSGARILIADDEDSLRWVLEKGLRQAGYEVTSVKDGDSAVRAFTETPFDLVFLDVRMRAWTASPPSPGCARCAPMPTWWS